MAHFNYGRWDISPSALAITVSRKYPVGEDKPLRRVVCLHFWNVRLLTRFVWKVAYILLWFSNSIYWNKLYLSFHFCLGRPVRCVLDGDRVNHLSRSGKMQKKRTDGSLGQVYNTLYTSRGNASGERIMSWRNHFFDIKSTVLGAQPTYPVIP